MATRQKLPYKLTPLKERDQKDVMSKFRGFSKGMVEVEGGKHLMPSHYAHYADKYFNFELKSDDVVIMTFPRSGTTWTQEIVWLMRNNLDKDAAQKIPLNARSPFIEFDSLHPPHLPVDEELKRKYKSIYPDKDPLIEGYVLGMSDATKSPRTLKTHLCLSIFNPKALETCKIVYVARNPKDACVSYYHQQRLVRVAEFTGNFEEYVDFWCRDLILQAPYWNHLSEAWEQRDHPNMHFMFYEDMKNDFMKELRRLNSFLETNLTEDQLRDVAHFTDFSAMKTRQDPHHRAAQEKGFAIKGEADFMRKGATKDWMNYFTPDLERKFQRWISKREDIAKQLPFQYT